MTKKLLCILLISLMLVAMLGHSLSFKNDSQETVHEETVSTVVFTYPDQAKVAFLGPLGTFSHEAATIVEGKEVEFVEKASVEEVLEALDDGECTYAVVPIENTIGGLTGKDDLYLNMILDRDDVTVVCEVDLPIRQTLIGMNGAELKDIKKVYSHPQGLTQGKEWMEENIPDVETEVVNSTAEGVKIVSELQDKSCAAIASPAAAEVFDLSILAENIQIITTNVTRFYVVTKGTADMSGDHALISVTCRAEKLPELMKKITDNNASLVSVHERPAKTVLNEYEYVIELSNANEKVVSALLEEDDAKCLGVFTSVRP
ncbi:MAG: hypothetical protein HUJ57_07555 [Erysipelotrichaceae bacterium]|mgnify:FL=1|nr:hypothetical protein [Erysipelotrichaceae bacterium]